MSRQACVELAERVGVDPDELAEWWSERAAVREYEGGQSRAEAEQSAFEDVERVLEIAPWVVAQRRGPKSTQPHSADLDAARKQTPK